MEFPKIQALANGWGLFFLSVMGRKEKCKHVLWKLFCLEIKFRQSSQNFSCGGNTDQKWCRRHNSVNSRFFIASKARNQTKKTPKRCLPFHAHKRLSRNNLNPALLRKTRNLKKACCFFRKI